MEQKMEEEKSLKEVLVARFEDERKVRKRQSEMSSREWWNNLSREDKWIHLAAFGIMMIIVAPFIELAIMILTFVWEILEMFL